MSGADHVSSGLGVDDGPMSAAAKPKPLLAVLGEVDDHLQALQHYGHSHELREAMVTVRELSADAARYRFLRDRLLAADFDWNETGESVLVFKWPRDVGIGGDCDQNIDAAIATATGNAA